VTRGIAFYPLRAQAGTKQDPVDLDLLTDDDDVHMHEASGPAEEVADHVAYLAELADASGEVHQSDGHLDKVKQLSSAPMDHWEGVSYCAVLPLLIAASQPRAPRIRILSPPTLSFLPAQQALKDSKRNLRNGNYIPVLQGPLGMREDRTEWPEYVLSDPRLAECWSNLANKNPTPEERQAWCDFMRTDPRLKACYKQAADSLCLEPHQRLCVPKGTADLGQLTASYRRACRKLARDYNRPNSGKLKVSRDADLLLKAFWQMGGYPDATWPEIIQHLCADVGIHGSPLPLP
jgi:hypothetical protein